MAMNRMHAHYKIEKIMVAIVQEQVDWHPACTNWKLCKLTA